MPCTLCIPINHICHPCSLRRLFTLLLTIVSLTHFFPSARQRIPAKINSKKKQETKSYCHLSVNQNLGSSAFKAMVQYA